MPATYSELVELIHQQHVIIEQQQDVIADLLLLLDKYQGAPLPKAPPKRHRTYKRAANFCKCGKAISPRAANCMECNAKAMVVVRLCACGNKRRADSEVCRECYTAAVKPARAKRHDLCACGTKKRKESEQCTACFKRSQRAKSEMHACGCAVVACCQ